MKHTTKQMGFRTIDHTIFKYSTILLIGLVIPFSLAHETGHLIPCWASGFEGEMNVGLVGGSAICYGLNGSQLFAFAGGFFAFLIAFTPLLIPKIRQNRSLLIVLGSFGIAHLMTAILETFARDFYMSSEATIPISMISFMIFIVMLGTFGKKKELTV